VYVVSEKRLIEVDAFRGIAIIAMVIFHAVFDYVFFVSPSFNLFSGPWFWVGRFAACSFVFLAGAALYLRLYRKKITGDERVADLIQRGIFLLVLGFVITLFTLLFFPDYPIWFGVLHLLGLATLLSIPLVKRPRLALALGLFIAVMGVLGSVSWGGVSFPPWIVVFPFSFPTLDYFPLFPWMGIFLIGIWFGRYAFPNGVRRFDVPFRSSVVTAGLAWIGRRSIWIYFLHQPVLVGVLLVMSYFF